MIDRVMFCTVSLAMAVLSFVILGITNFNATYVFSGYTRETIDSLAAWFRFAEEHRDLARESLLLGSSAMGAAVLAASFLVPVLVMLIAKPASYAVRVVLSIQALLLALDSWQLLSNPATRCKLAATISGLFTCCTGYLASAASACAFTYRRRRPAATLPQDASDRHSYKAACMVATFRPENLLSALPKSNHTRTSQVAENSTR